MKTHNIVSIDEFKTIIEKNSRLLGIDPGNRNIGFAICDENKKVATPLKIFQKSKFELLLKEIKLRPVTELHDYQFKIKNAKKFISKEDKVKFTIRFKGRELQHSHLGKDLMDKIKIDMQEIGKVELNPKFEGKQMIMVIQPL